MSIRCHNLWASSKSLYIYLLIWGDKISPTNRVYKFIQIEMAKYRAREAKLQVMNKDLSEETNQSHFRL